MNKPMQTLQYTKPRYEWIYANQLAGLAERWENLEILTVNGAGHFVPMDRAGPALQMLYNYIQNTGDYSKPFPMSPNITDTQANVSL